VRGAWAVFEPAPARSEASAGRCFAVKIFLARYSFAVRAMRKRRHDSSLPVRAIWLWVNLVRASRIMCSRPLRC